MKTFWVFGWAILVLGYTSSAWTQSREQCEGKKNDVASMKNQVSALDGEITGLDARLTDLSRQQNELQNEKGRKQTERSVLLNRARTVENEVARACRFLQECRGNEDRVDRLRSRLAPLADKLRAIGEELRALSDTIANHSREVDRIENQYNQLGCSNLVPGETAQSTIDTCTDLFSQWNHLQSDINRSQGQVDSLRPRYAQVMNEMASLRQEINILLGSLRRSCSDSSRMAELEGMDRDQAGYVDIKKDIEELGGKIQRFRAVRILKPELKIQTKQPVRPQDMQPVQPKKLRPALKEGKTS